LGGGGGGGAPGRERVALVEDPFAELDGIDDPDDVDEGAPRAGGLSCGFDLEPTEPEVAHDGSLEHLEVGDLLEGDGGFGFVPDALFDLEGP